MGLNSWVTLVKGFATALLACSLATLPVWGADEATLDRLEQIIKQQQDQIDAQQRALEALQREVDALRGPAAEAAVQTAADRPAVVTTSVPQAKVKLYGQVNKAVLYSNDGDDGNFYLVDNDHSSTRIGLLGSINPNDRFEVGTRIEVEYQTNPSGRVSQVDERISDTRFEKRWLDLWVDAHRFGKFSLGWGSTASDGTSEMDLSGTSVVGHSDIADMAGGQLFYDATADALSDTAVRNVFSNMDGLGRDERIRYDSPSFGGFVGSVSYIADGGGDVALRYTARTDAFKLAAGAAYANPGSTSDRVDEQLAGSVSVLHDSGFNVTMALGTRDHKAAGRDSGAFFYTKFGYQGRWCPLGVTALSADYGRYADIAVNGDDADVFGLQMVQDLQAWGSEAYLGYRLHQLDRSAVDFDEIAAVMAGMRVKF